MKQHLPNVSRRNILKGGTALGMSALMPAFLAACGGGSSDDDADSSASRRETRDMHFDLSHGAIVDPELRLGNSKHDRVRLAAHSAESRQRFRAADPVLQGVPDEKLTHYLEGVDLPANALQLGSVYGVAAGTGKPALALHFIHVPRSSLEKLQARRVKRGQSGRQLSAKLRHYGIAQAALDAAPIQSQIGPRSAPFDIATTLIFQHPAITNLDPDLGADILDRIQNLSCDPDDDSCNPYAGDIAYQIALMIGANNYPSTTPSGSWATLKTIPDLDTGLPSVDQAGNPIYSFDLNPALSDTIATAVKAILNDINDDPLFMGTNWQSPAGGVSEHPQPTQLAAAVGLALADDVFSVASSVPIGSRTSGIRLKNISTDDSREVHVTVVNEFLRSAGVYVQYYDATGKSLKNTTPTTFDDGDAYFTNVIISPQTQIMGIPLQGDQAVVTDFRFTMPAEAAKANVYYAGLGLGGMDAFSKKAISASVLTAVLGIGVPSMFLFYGITITAQWGFQQAIREALGDPIILSNILKAVASQLASGSIAAGVQSSATNLSAKPFLISIGTLAMQLLMRNAPRLAVKLVLAVQSSELAYAAPIAGLALAVLSTAADLATIGETIIECLSCPAIDVMSVSLTMSSSVQINRDCDDFQFPATARTWTVKAFYDGGATPVVVKGTVTPGTTGPIDVPLVTLKGDGTTTGVPSGGKVSAEVYFYSASGCLVGHGTSDTIANMPDSSTGTLVIPVTIKELLVPLDATTKYDHTSKLVYDGSAHRWSMTAPPPALTRANLCQGNDGAVCALNGITVHTASGMVGYGYDAGGQNVGPCFGGSATSLNRVQNLFLGDNPDSGLRAAPCGTGAPIGIAYSPTGPATGGKNFFLQPAADGTYHLRSTDLTAGSFDFQQTQSWGRFSSPLDSMTVTSNGYVVGVNRATHKIWVLQLPAAAASPTSEVKAVPFGTPKGGKGLRAGLLNTPVAVASFNGALLVLEQGNRRVQAFNPDGDTIAMFKDSSGADTEMMPLADSAGVTYLDIAVEGAGYIYVLGYSDSGATSANYRLEVYTPTGQLLSRTTNVAAGGIAVDLFRNVYTLNYETVANAPLVEPSLSQWEPVSATPCPSTSAAAAGMKPLLASCPTT